MLPDLQTYLQNGLSLVRIPKGMKGPKGQEFIGWSAKGAGISNEIDLMRFRTEDWNWGLHHLDSGTCAIDIDHYPVAQQQCAEKGIDLAALLNTDLRIDSGVLEHYKLLYRIPEWIGPIPSKQLHFPDPAGKPKASLNFRCCNRRLDKTQQDVLPPSIHPDTDRPYQWLNGDVSSLTQLPDPLLSMWLELQQRPTEQPTEDTEPTPEVTTSEERIQDALRFVDPDLDRDKWIEVAMAIHASRGEAGYHLFLDWSSRGTKFIGEHDTRAVWASIPGDPRGITYRTLYRYAKAGGWKPTPTWEEISSIWAKNPEGEDPSEEVDPEVQIAAELREEIQHMGPMADTNPAQVTQVQKIMLRAQQIKDPGLYLPLLDLIQHEMQWNKARLNSHLRYIKEGANKVLHEASGTINFPQRDGDVLRDHTDNVEAICQHYGITVRHNLMSHDIEITDPQHPHWLKDDEANLQLSHLTNVCVEHGMPRARMDEHVSMLGAKYAYHPMAEYLNSLKWDGRDWFTLVADTVKVVDRPLWLLTLERWAMSICAAVREVTFNRPPRGVLVMTGAQLAGKTSWFRYLTPDTNWFGEGLSLDPSNKDLMKLAVKYAIVELGEMDSILNKGQMSRLKAFLSSPYDEMRLPYARKESKWKRRTIFCGTVNHATFLTDTTGNTRFWTNEVETFDLDAMEALHMSGNIGQFWAQMNERVIQGFPWWMSREEMLAIEGSNVGHEEPNIYQEMLEDTFAWPETWEVWGEWSPVNPMSLTDIAASMGLDIKGNNSYLTGGLRTALVKLTGQTRTNRVRRHTWDAVNNLRNPHAMRGRYYNMPYLYRGEKGQIARVVTPNVSVLQFPSTTGSKDSHHPDHQADPGTH